MNWKLLFPLPCTLLLVTHSGGTEEPVQNKQILIEKIEMSKIKEFRKGTVDYIMLPQIVWKMNKIF